MELQDDILKGFSDAINSINTPSTEGTRSVYATAIKDESGLYVRFDGSDVNTPAISMVECGDGDRVLATWKGHTAVITGNISYPSLTRKGNIYMTMTNDGLVIGLLSEEDNKPVGYYVLIRPADDNTPGVEIIDTQGRIVSHFGVYAYLGKVGGSRLLAGSGGVNIFNKDGIDSAFYGDYVRLGKVNSAGTYLGPHVFINNNGFQICNTANTIQAVFNNDWARLGYYNNQHINITSSSVDVCEYSNGQEVSVAKLAAKARIGKESGQHVAITDSSVDINKGSTSYATFGTTARIGTSSGQHLNINSGSVEILNGSTSYASFGTTARIGRSNNSHVNIDSDSVDVYVGNTSYSSASFGSTTTIGRTDGRNVQITSSSINLRYKTTTVASFTENTVTLAQGAASFSSNAIALGGNSAEINLCNSATIKYSDSSNSFSIGANSLTKIMTLFNTGDGYSCQIGINSDKNSAYNSTKHTVGIQIRDTNKAKITTSLILNEFGAYFTTPSNVYIKGYPIITGEPFTNLVGFTSQKFSINSHVGKAIECELDYDVYIYDPDTDYNYALLSIVKMYSNTYGVVIQGWDHTVTNSITVYVYNANENICTNVVISGKASMIETSTAVSYPVSISTVS